MISTKRNRPLRCLLLGYNGAGNTGSDIRLCTIVDDVQEALGPETEITVVTIDAPRTAAVLSADPHVHVAQISFSPFRFVFRIWRLISQNDLMLLIEGSTFKQNWSVWLLHAYLWAAVYGWVQRRPVVAYAVDVGHLKSLHAWFTGVVVGTLSLVITRTQVARDRLRKLGVTREVIANTDTAFRFESKQTLRVNDRPVLGFAPIEFFHWPVRFRPWGRPELIYRWPFAFSWDEQRRELSEKMLESWVGLARHVLTQHDCDLVLFGMEDLDAPVCEKIAERLPGEFAHRISFCLSRETVPRDVVERLRGLDLLVTSRYHACVLSMAGGVPQMAIAHDERLASIYAEMGIDKEFLLDYRQPDLSERMIPTFDELWKQRDAIQRLISEQTASRYLPLCAKNATDLAEWAQRKFNSNGSLANLSKTSIGNESAEMTARHSA